MPSLEAPTTRVRLSFLVAMAEARAEGSGWPDDYGVVGGDMRRRGETWESPEGFERYVQWLREQEIDDATRPAGYVPCTTLWWVDDKEYLGRIDIRHRLTPWLHEVGGHIGYDVRPSARRRGYATAMLAAALPIARRIGIGSALVTCDVDNIGSRKVIENNGGVLEDQRGIKLRYWVPTGP